MVVSGKNMVIFAALFTMKKIVIDGMDRPFKNIFGKGNARIGFSGHRRI
jgi:hypothetical protein